MLYRNKAPRQVAQSKNGYSDDSNTAFTQTPLYHADIT